MPDLDEPRVLDGMRSWSGSQRAYAGVPDPQRDRLVLDVGWYGTGVDEHEGAFCMVLAGGPLEDLIGDVVRVARGQRAAYVYCLGASAALPTSLALSRPAFLRMAALGDGTARLVVQAT